MADWSTLPTELLHLISQYIPASIDLIRFRSICATWRAAAPPPPSAASHFPILPSSGIVDISWGFHLSKRIIYSLQSPFTNESTWIIKLERDNLERMHLLDPLAQSQYKPLPGHFPKMFNFFNVSVRELGIEYALQYNHFGFGEPWNLYKEKVAVLDNFGDGYMLLTIHMSRKLVVFNSGDEKWRLIDDLPTPYDDVILRKWKFYAVDNTGRLVLVNGVFLNVSAVANPIFGGDKKFLVDSNGELLLVDMYLCDPADDLGFNDGFEFYDEFDVSGIVKFKVFKLDENVEKWMEMSDLGDRMLFLGDNCSFSASTSEIFGDDRFKGNCIFFTNQYCTVDGVFDLESGSIVPIGSHIDYSEMFWPPPDWVYSTASIEVSSGLSFVRLLFPMLLRVNWAHHRSSLPSNWFLSSISTLVRSDKPSSFIEAAKAGLSFLFGIEALSCSPVKCVPIVWKLHTMSVILLSGMEILKDEKSRDVYGRLQDVYGENVDRKMLVLQFKKEIHEDYATFIETLVKQFAAESYGDVLFGRQVAMYLHRYVEASVRLATWDALSNTCALELLPPVDECFTKAEGFLEPIEDNMGILEAYVKPWVSGALDKAANRSSVTFSLVLHHISSFAFGDVSGDLLWLRCKLTKSLLRDYSRKHQHEGMMVKLLCYTKPNTTLQSDEHLVEIQKRLQLLKEICGGHVIEVEKLESCIRREFNVRTLV